jgi:hypothetical protein
MSLACGIGNRYKKQSSKCSLACKTYAYAEGLGGGDTDVLCGSMQMPSFHQNPHSNNFFKTNDKGQ